MCLLLTLTIFDYTFIIREFHSDATISFIIIFTS